MRHMPSCLQVGLGDAVALLRWPVTGDDSVHDHSDFHGGYLFGEGDFLALG